MKIKTLNSRKNIKKIQALLLGVIVLLSFSSAPRASSSAEKIDLTVASYNMMTTSRAPIGPRLAKQVKYAESNKFDIIGAQEISYKDHFNTIKSQNGFGKSYAIYPKSYTTMGSSGRPILYNKERFALVSGSYIAYPSYSNRYTNTPQKTQAPVVLLRDKSTGVEFYVINTHNSAFNEAKRVKARYDSGLKYRDFISRVHKTGRPVLFTGDFNETAALRSKVYENKKQNLNYCILSRGDLMRFAGAAVNGQKGCAYSGHDSVDRIYVTSDVKVNDYRLLVAGMKRAGTDHAKVARAKVTIFGPAVAHAELVGLSQQECASLNRVWQEGRCASYCIEGYQKDPGDNKKCLKITKQYADLIKPTVKLILPEDGKIYSQSVVFSAEAQDNVGISKVEFYANGRRLFTDKTEKYQQKWDVTKVKNGVYSIYAVAYDVRGSKQQSDTISIIVDHENPSSEDFAGQ